MIRLLLWLETAITLPVFIISWLACSVWYAIRAGQKMAALPDEEAKREILAQLRKTD